MNLLKLFKHVHVARSVFSAPGIVGTYLPLVVTSENARSKASLQEDVQCSHLFGVNE